MLGFFKRKNYQIMYESHWNSFKISNVEDYTNFKHILEKQINLFWRNNVFIHKINHIEFAILSSHEDFKMFVNTNNISNEKCLVTINVNKLISDNSKDEILDKEKLEKNLFECLTHEFVHIRHWIFHQGFKKSYNLLITRAARRNSYFLKSNRGIKELLALIQNDLLVEGLATFYEKEREYSICEFERDYESYLHKIFSLNKILTDILNTQIKAFKKNPDLFIKCSIDEIGSQRICYDIGYLMIYSILLAFDKLSIEDLLDLSEIKFYKLYEESVSIINKNYHKEFKILVSYNSKKGIYDYSKYLNLIYKSEQIKNKNISY